MKHSSQGSQTVARAMGVLRLVSSRAREGMRMQDIVNAGILSRPTVHRLLAELVDSGLLTRSSERLYFLGPFAYELGIAAASRFHLRELCEPSVQRIAQQTGDTASLVTRSGADAFCLDCQRGDYPPDRRVMDIGSRQPLEAVATGLALLGCLPAAEVDRMMAHHGAQFSLPASVLAESLPQALACVRQKGYAKSIHDADTKSGITCIGVAVRDADGHPVFALGVEVAGARMTSLHEAQVLEVLGREALLLSDALYPR